MLQIVIIAKAPPRENVNGHIYLRVGLENKIRSNTLTLEGVITVDIKSFHYYLGNIAKRQLQMHQ